MSSKSGENHRPKTTAPSQTANVQATFHQAMDFHQRGQLAEAKQRYESVLNAMPRHFDALHLLGVIASQTGNHRQAVELIEKAIEIYPANAAFYSNLGNALQALGRFGEAVERYNRAIAIQSDFADACNNRGNALHALGRFEEAVESYNRAIGLRPDYVEAFYNRGLALKDLKRTGDALESFDQAIAFQPGYAEAWNNRGNALQALKRAEEALESFRRATVLRPNYADAWYNHGNALQELKRPEEAVGSFERAVALRPDYADAWHSCGNVLHALGHFDEALKSYNRAIAIRPDYADTHNNRGNALKEIGHLEEALSSYDRAIALWPDYADAHWNKALALLLTGNYAQGWPLYEWRWRLGENTPSPIRNFQEPLWLGDTPLAGKTILLHSEQGLGDAIHFCRYAQLVADLGAQVVLEVGQPLVSALKNLKGVSEVIAKGAPLPPFDYHCPLMSLPLAFHTTLETIPHAPPYLETDRGRREQWAARLGEKSKPRIGLVWAGGTVFKNDRNRSITLGALRSHLPDGFQYVSLQKELRDPDRPILQAHTDILHFGDEIGDFSDTAALCELVDLVISVDTSVAHLAGALGKKMWVLLPFAPDFRWLLHRDDSPWYPSARLYRQDRPGNWKAVFEKIRMDLQNLATA